MEKKLEQFIREDFREHLQSLEEGNPLARDVKQREQGLHKVIISAHREGNTPEQNNAAQKQLMQTVRDAGYSYKKAKGQWTNAEGRKESENSIVIHAKGAGEDHGKDLVKFGHKLRKTFNQDAFIHRKPSGEGMAHNRDGSTDVYGKKTSYNTDNPYGETAFRGKKAKMTFTDD